jgi:hypothetical protein
MNATKVLTKDYENIRPHSRAENKPKQTQFYRPKNVNLGNLFNPANPLTITKRYKKMADNPKGYQPIYDKPTPQKAPIDYFVFTVYY